MSLVPRQPSDYLPDVEPLRGSWQRSADRYHIEQGSRQAPWILTAQELSVSRAPVDELIGIAAHENDRFFAAVGKVGYGPATPSISQVGGFSPRHSSSFLVVCHTYCG